MTLACRPAGELRLIIGVKQNQSTLLPAKVEQTSGRCSITRTVYERLYLGQSSGSQELFQPMNS